MGTIFRGQSYSDSMILFHWWKNEWFLIFNIMQYMTIKNQYFSEVKTKTQ